MRTALCLAACLFAASAHAASIDVVPFPNSIEIQPVFVDVTQPTTWSIKSPTGPNPFPNNGWIDRDFRNLNSGQGPPAHWVLPAFYVDRTEALFLWRPRFFPLQEHAKVDIAEFVAAGDSSIVLRIDSSIFNGTVNVPIETITWESPSLGVVTRTYVRAPEPASAALLALGSAILLRRRKLPASLSSPAARTI